MRQHVDYATGCIMNQRTHIYINKSSMSLHEFSFTHADYIAYCAERKK